MEFGFINFKLLKIYGFFDSSFTLTKLSSQNYFIDHQNYCPLLHLNPKFFGIIHSDPLIVSLLSIYHTQAERYFKAD